MDELVRALRAPAVAARLPEREVEGKRGYVWHCSARVAAGDRVLSDTDWADIARELLDGAGIAARGDGGGPRWVAIRHADDHIHIAVVLVRQDTCRRVWPKRDYPRLRATARAIEQRLGLTPTAGPDGTAAPAPTRGEIEKAHRQGRREPARVALARMVRSAAASAMDPITFVTALTAAGVEVELRRAPSGDLLGYKVARAGDVARDGTPVFYSGSKLAPDLSLPRLMRGWAQAAQGVDVTDPIAGARRRVNRARSVVRAARHGQLGEDPHDVAQAALDVVVAVRGWGPEFAAAADRFARLARPPRGVQTQAGVTGARLRRVARQLSRLRHFGVTDDPAAAGVALVVALAALLVEIAAWQQEKERPHQAAAARDASRELKRWVQRHDRAEQQAAVLVDGRARSAATQRPQHKHAARGPVR